MAGMGEEGFEPPKAMPLDLQSSLVVHLSILPKTGSEGFEPSAVPLTAGCTTVVLRTKM